MYRKLSRRRDERGVVAILTAAIALALILVAALVVDIGLVRVDRQIDKSAADSATLAGLHALNAGDGQPHPYLGVCTAIRYLQSSDRRFAAISDTAGTWTKGDGSAAPNGCTDATAQAQPCVPGTPASWAKFDWTGSLDGRPLKVSIQSGYQLSTSSGYSEDSLPAAAAENNDNAQGCDQLAVLVTQTRNTTLGALATDDLTTSIRSVGRVKQSPGGYAPAMLLLQQTGCTVLAGANTNTKVYIAGAVASNGLTQPGTIHSDSDGGNCGNNTWVYEGKQSDNIVAFAAPMFTDQSQPDPGRPGQITLYGAAAGAGSHLYDSDSRVCGSKNLYVSPVAAGQCPNTANPIRLAGRVYRKPVDDRYLGAVQTIRDNAKTEFAAAPSYANQLSGGNCSTPPAALTSALTAADKLYVNCASFGPAGNVTINAGTIVFAGTVVNPANLSMPNATKVYVAGDPTVAQNKVGISLANNTSFSMHTASNLAGGSCSSSPTGPETSTLTTNKAVLVVKNGVINMSGGQFRACYTTVVMLSGKGSSDACMPATSSQAAPSSNPCTGSSYTPGTGQISQTGGNVDWTAPNQHELMVNADGSTNTDFQAAWSDPNGPEDLAFWSESANGNPAYRLTGGGVVHLVGVFMIPNAQPLTLAGQFAQELVNAQFIAGSISLAGGSIITMKVDPASAVTLPKLSMVGLVR